MKLLLLTTLLVLLLCSQQVNMLKCYTCDDENDDLCKTVTVCPASSTVCKTTWSDDKLFRTCEELCTPSLDVECCEEDLCGEEDDYDGQ